MKKRSKTKLSWAKRNPDKVRDSLKKYHTEHKLPLSLYYSLVSLAFPKINEKKKNRTKKWNKANEEVVLSHKAKYREENLEAIKMHSLLKYYAMKDGMYSPAASGRPKIY
jgi:hypothetical protein